MRNYTKQNPCAKKQAGAAQVHTLCDDLPHPFLVPVATSNAQANNELPSLLHQKNADLVGFTRTLLHQQELLCHTAAPHGFHKTDKLIVHSLNARIFLHSFRVLGEHGLSHQMQCG